jgi:hypothetical protein
MDMRQATGTGGLPDIVGVTASNGASLSGSPIADHDKMSVIHGITMAFVFLIMYPFNAIIIELLKWRNVGAFFSIPFHILMLTAFALGISVSKEYLRVRFKFKR